MLQVTSCVLGPDVRRLPPRPWCPAGNQDQQRGAGLQPRGLRACARIRPASVQPRSCSMRPLRAQWLGLLSIFVLERRPPGRGRRRRLRIAADPKSQIRILPFRVRAPLPGPHDCQRRAERSPPRFLGNRLGKGLLAFRINRRRASRGEVDPRQFGFSLRLLRRPSPITAAGPGQRNRQPCSP